MTNQAPAPINGTFVYTGVLTYRAIQFTGPDSIPAIREVFKDIGFYDEDVRRHGTSLKIPASDVKIYDEASDTFIVYPDQVIVVSLYAGSSNTYVIDVTEHGAFWDNFESAEDKL